jgi:predicted nucleic acid-binding protein
MPGSVFLDTSGWITLLNASEPHHQNAHDLWLELGERGYRIVLTDWIIAETGNGLARTRARSEFASSVDKIWQSPTVEIVVVDRSLVTRAIDRYRRFTDKTWGLVDCASFIVMEERGIAQAFSSDHDFEQAGFNCLLSV